MADKKSPSGSTTETIIPTTGTSKEQGGYLSTPVIKPVPLNEGFSPTPIIVNIQNPIVPKDTAPPKRK